MINKSENPLGWRPPASPCDNRLGRQPPDTPKRQPRSAQASSFTGDLSLPSPVTSKLACTKHLAVVARDPLSIIWPHLAGVLALRRPTRPASQHPRFACVLAAIPLHPVSPPFFFFFLFLFSFFFFY